MSIFDWSTTAASNGNSDPTVNFLEGQAPSSLNDSARALMARLSHWRNWFAGNMTQGGASNAYTITSGESLSAYTAAMRFLWKPNAASTGAVTINIDGLGAKKVYLPSGSQAGSGDISANAIYDLVYIASLDSSNGGFKIVGPPDATNTALFLLKASNLSDVADAATARSNLGALAAASYTAADVLAKLLTVDGAGSGLDADTLDGVQGSAYARLALGQTFTALQQFQSTADTVDGIRLTNTGNSRRTHIYPGKVGSQNGDLEIDAQDGNNVNFQTSGTTRAQVTPNGAFTNGRKAASVASGSSAEAGRISWGTGSPGTLAEGEIYLRHA